MPSSILENQARLMVQSILTSTASKPSFKTFSFSGSSGEAVWFVVSTAPNCLLSHHTKVVLCFMVRELCNHQLRELDMHKSKRSAPSVTCESACFLRGLLVEEKSCSLRRKRKQNANC